jgi:hypothetical protein
MKNWVKRNPKKTVIALSLIALIVVLFVFEIYLAATADYNKAFDFRYIRLREHIPGTLIRDRTLPKGSLLRVDESGFIEPSIVHDEPDLQIVFLGGSTTECLIVEEVKRFPYVVGRVLERETSLKVNTINCGCRGNTSAHSINSLFNKIVPLKPDYVVLMHNVNDLVLLAYMGTYWNDHFTRSLIVETHHGLLEATKLMIINTFPNLYGFLKQKGYLDLEALIHEQLEDEWKEFRDLQVAINPEGMKRMFADNLRAFVKLCRNFGITPVLMTQPSNGEDPGSVINKISIFEMHPEFNAVVQYIAREENVHLINLAKEMKDPNYFHDFVHLNNYGSSVATRIIAHNLLHLLKTAEQDPPK